MSEQVVEQAAAPQSKVVLATLKGDCGTIEVDLVKLPDDIYDAVMMAGLEAIINKVGMSKLMPGITKAEGTDKEERIAKIRQVAQATVEAMYKGSIKGASKAKKASGAVETEALRLAKMMAKEQIKAAGQKVGAYSAKEQTALAKMILDRNRGALVAAAEKNLSERAGAIEALKMPGLEEVFGAAKANDPANKAKPKVAPKRKAKGEGDAPSAAVAAKAAPKREKPQSQAKH